VSRGVAKAAAWAGGLVALICIGVLAFDDITARVATRAYDKRVEELQALVHEDAKFAPVLEAEHKRVADARRARKARINWISLTLIAGAAVFLWGAKQLPRRSAASHQPAVVSNNVPPPPALKPRGTAPQPVVDLSPVDAIIARYGRTTEAAIPILQGIQAHYRYLPDEALRRVCELTDITPAQLAGTSSFYAQMRRSPVGKHVVRVCHGTACHVSGARQITEELRRSLGIPDGADTDPDRMFTLDEVACLGCCSLAPVMMVDQHTAGKLTPASARAVVDQIEHKEPA
jgi:NADH:ubiquinone oxidoreductase subunit E